MTILIVDDEFYLVQGVKKALNWEDYGIDTIYTAYSADQARKVYEENHVDILLCDIEMPRENGLSLIKWVVDNGYDSVNILLTGHASFEYARTAVHLQIMEYVLKPVDENSLGEVIKKASDVVKSLHDQKKTEYDNAMKSLWHRLYSGTLSPDPDSISEYINDTNLDNRLLVCSFSYAYLQIYSSTIFSDSGCITDFFDTINDLKIFVAQVDVGRFMLSVMKTCSKDESDITDSLLNSHYNNLLKILKNKYPDYRFVLYTFSDAPITAAPYAYELLQQYSENILSLDSKVISIMTPELWQLSEKTKEHSQSIPLEKWEEYLSQGRTKDILLNIRGLVMQTDTTYSSKYLQSIYYGLLSITFAVLTQKKCSPIMVSEEMSRSADPRAITSSPEDLYNWAQDLMRTVDVLVTNTDSQQSVTEQIKQYIKQHISDPDLSRTTIAESVHISQDYLSFLFHRETGMVLSAYINSERINAAKKLLLNSSLSSQEIAEKTGFSNVSYFHKQFKKVTGMTPNSYKEEYTKS